MKLLYITNGVHYKGGLERVLSIKANYLTDVKNYEVHFFVLNQKELPCFYNFSSKITFHDIIISGNLLQCISKYLFGLRAVIKKVNPDVISVCDDGLKGFFAPKLFSSKIPIIYERHISKLIEIGPNPSMFKAFFASIKYLAMDYFATKFDKFVILTDDTRNEWDLKNIIVIPNPLGFYPLEVAKLENKKVIAVGRHCYQKGFDLLLKSWKIVHEHFPDWTLEIYGEKDPTVNLFSQIESLELDGSVALCEPTANIQQKYLESSVFVLSSRFEGFGNVIIEAMACGVTSVSFDCPFGPKAIISDNINGFLIANGDIISFAEKIMELMRDKEKRKKMGESARIKSMMYLPEVILPQWDKLFKELYK